LRQAQETASFCKDVSEALKALGAGDDVEEIAMFAGRCVRPLAGGAFAAVRPGEAHKQAASRRILGVANEPICALSPAVRQVAPTDSLGIPRKRPGEFPGRR
jgi:hypothetical protein